MTDFEYDCMERKHLARQAKYKKSGAKSKKCSLGTDHMTPKQWKERNGAVMTLKKNEPMTWDEFKSLSVSLQEEYIRFLIDNYNVNMKSLSEMFGVSRETIGRYFEKNNINIKFHVGCSMTREQRDVWMKFVFGDNAADTRQDTHQTDEPGRGISFLAPSVVEDGMSMKSFSLSFGGKIDVNMIANSLLHILGKEAVGEVQIICNLAKSVS